MATLALSVAGAAAGSALLPGGVSFLGVTLSGAAIGAQVGALAGSFVDQALFSASGETRTVEGPRLRDLHVTSSSEGAPIPRIYGRVRLGGQVIWATAFEEEVVRSNESANDGGGKGLGGLTGGGNGGSGGVERVEYRYYANFAVAIAAGPIGGIGRIWADGAELDLSGLTYRVHRGGEGQALDPLIVAREGASKTPAYRGLAYIVFERLPLAPFGNRLPQLSFEVHRTLDGFNKEVKGVVLIPGSGEFVYAPNEVSHKFGIGGSIAENVHTRQGGTDWKVALDQLDDDLPNVENISLVVSWFGTDLRCGECEIRPGVEVSDKTTVPYDWVGGGVTRSEAWLVSQREGRPAYGGTPSDEAVIEAIRDLKDRGYGVTLTPFVLMDVPADNALPDPYSGLSGQPVYPWRGRITCSPAPGVAGSPDKSSAAAAQVASFVGTAAPGDFAISGDAVAYSGPEEWSYRRMVLHQAYLAKAAGGVDAFLLGTELRGLSWVRSGASSYPFVDALAQLAADVKGVLGAGTKVTYAADWTEYFGHQPQDGSGDVYFHLDALWASPHIDAVGIDCYWPLADWRDGRNHLDYLDGVRSVYDLDYLSGNVAGGEGYDWYYASAADRDAQVRTPITDGSGKPWVFRYKDAKSWWSNAHYHRPGGVEAASPTAWVPESKPIWLMEIGCPAADKGANQPNVFVDPKSSENALPYYSQGYRDDLMQRRYIQALIRAFDPESNHYVPGLNPVSGIYGGRMVDTSRVFVYCWDARPYPAFPQNLDVWGDGENWALGHWLNGRLSAMPLSILVAKILEECGFFDHQAGGLAGVVPGYVIDRPMSAREALQPLGLSYFFDAVETGGTIAFRHRGSAGTAAVLSQDDLVESHAAASLATLTRAQETELPSSAKVSYISGATDYAEAVAEARRLVGGSGRLAQASLPIVFGAESASAVAEVWLHESWASRERAEFELGPRFLELEPGDVVDLEVDGDPRPYRITEISDGTSRRVKARSIDADVYSGVTGPSRNARPIDAPPSGVPEVVFLDLPLLRGDESEEAGYVAAIQDPWPGLVAVYGSAEPTGYRLRSLVTAPAIVGETLTMLRSGPVSRIDYASRLQVKVGAGELASASRTQLLAGSNILAVEWSAGVWEVLQFETAELIGERTYELSGFLRGQAGTEAAMAAPEELPAGARVVLIDNAVFPVSLTLDELRLPYFWRYGDASKDLAGEGYAVRQHSFAGVGLRPYAPAHLRILREPSGDVQLNWIRRTRIGGDGWESAEVPMGESAEQYRVEVLDAEGAAVRSIETDAPEALYAAADQIADFGVLPAAVDVRVAQLSAVAGPGSWASARG